MASYATFTDRAPNGGLSCRRTYAQTTRGRSIPTKTHGYKEQTGHQRRYNSGRSAQRGTGTDAPTAPAAVGPSDVDDDVFLAECAAQNVLLEGCIIKAGMALNLTTLFRKQHDIVSRAVFASAEGDVFVLLNAMRAWVNELRTSGATGATWFEEMGLEQKPLQDIEVKVQAMYSSYARRQPKVPRLNFRGNMVAMTNSLTEILLRTHAQDLCVYTGHDALGYKRISDGQLITLNTASIFNVYTNRPKYIIPLIIDSNVNDIDIMAGKKILAINPVPKLQGSLALAVPEELATGILQENGCKTNSEVVKLFDLKVCDIGFKTSEILAERWTDMTNGQSSIATKIYQYFGNDVLIVADMDPVNCVLSVSSNKRHHTKIHKLIMTEIALIREDLSSGIVPIPYPRRYSPSSAVIGPGIQAEGYLFPRESVTSVVKSIPGLGTTWTDVVSTLEPMKDKVVFHKRPAADIREDILGTIETRSPEAMQKLLNTSHCYPFSVHPWSAAEVSAVVATPYHFIDNLSVTLTWKVHNDRYTKPRVNSADIAMVRATLCRALDDLQEDKVTVYIAEEQQDRRRGLVRATIRFSDHNTAHRGLDMLRELEARGIPLNLENPAEIESSLRSFSLIITGDMYKAVRKTLNARLENFKRSNMYKAEYSIIFKENGVVRLNLTTSSAYACIEVQSRLKDTLSGHLMVLNDKSAVNHFTSPEGQAILRLIMRDTDTCIIKNPTQNSLLIYGTKATRKIAEEAVLKHLDFINIDPFDHEEDVDFLFPNLFDDDDDALGKPYQFIHLQADGLPNDFLITLASVMQPYYIEPNYLVVKCPSGSPKERLVSLLIKAYNRIMKTSYSNLVDEANNTEMRSCVSCFLDLGPDDDSYVLEGCGHIYCMECLRTQVTDAIRTTSFPIMCAHDNQPFSASDFKNITEKLQITPLSKLLKASLRYFINGNPKTYKFCIRPDCHGVGRMKTSSLETFLQCSVCCKKACPQCLYPFHKFMTCAQAQESAFSINDWIKEDVKQRKRCPNCQIGIEKVTGCNRVTCSACNKNICWNCLQYFDTSQGCYDHLTKIHGGYGY